MSMGYVATAVGVNYVMNELQPDAPSPDPAIGQAANANARVAADTLQWYKDKDAEMKPLRDEAMRIGLDQARQQSALAERQIQRGDEAYDYSMRTFRPLETKIATDAMNYNTAARREAEATSATADVEMALDGQRQQTSRSMTRRGVNPGSGKALALSGAMDVASAAAKAGAANQARKTVEAVGSAKLADAANLGRGIATSNATQTQLGLTAGTSAVGNAQAPISIDAARGSQMNQGAGTAIQGNNSAGQLMLGQYNAVTSAGNNDALWGALGQAAGAYAARR